jgi:Leucine-rich repeat (LRR) protein
MKLLLLLLAFPIIGFGQNVNIPDANFKAYLVGNININTNGDNQIQVSEASVFNGAISLVTYSVGYVYGLNIIDLTGIEAFVALDSLNCSYNPLTSLDVSNNTALTTLYCSNNYLTSLDLSACTALTYLNCYGNPLTSLDISNCSALTVLYCSGYLTSLDVSSCTALTTLGCSGNQLTSLDVSNNTALTALYCSGNQLTSLDVSTCTVLTTLNCSSNLLTSLDVSNNTALELLYCPGNQLTSLDVSACTALITLYCYDNQLTSLDVSGCTALYSLWCNDNQLTSLDVSANTALTVLYCYNNGLTSLDLSTCTVLTSLQCYSNQLTSLNVKNGNNNNMVGAFIAYNNPNLSCIEVDNVAWSNSNWAFDIDATASFSLNCSGAGISEINESNTLILYPNPTNGDFTITGLELVGTVSSLSLTDMNGKAVKVLDTKATKFIMGSIKPGVYFLNIISGNKQEVLKIVKE